MFMHRLFEIVANVIAPAFVAGRVRHFKTRAKTTAKTTKS
jgi:hypothetical protein